MSIEKYIVLALLINASFFNAHGVDENSAIVSNNYTEYQSVEKEMADIRSFYHSYNRFGKNSVRALSILQETIDEAGIEQPNKKKIVKDIHKRIANEQFEQNDSTNTRQVFFNNIPVYDIFERRLPKEDVDVLYNLILEKRNKANMGVRIIDSNFYQLRQKKIIDSSYQSFYYFINSVL